MKLLVFSDLHGNAYAFRAALAQMADENADRWYFLGDVFGYYYGQAECFRRLKEIPSLTCLRGNHEELALDALTCKVDAEELVRRYGSSYRHLQELPDKVWTLVRSWPDGTELVADGLRIGFFHGTPDRPTQGRLYPDKDAAPAEAYQKYDVVFLGHTHHKMVKSCGATDIYNPGSLGQQRDGQGCSYIVYDTVTRDCAWRIVDYDVQPLLQEIRANDPGLQEKLCDPLLRQRGRWQPYAEKECVGDGGQR